MRQHLQVPMTITVGALGLGLGAGLLTAPADAAPPSAATIPTAVPVPVDEQPLPTVRVWATLDGDTPVRGARVRVFEGGRGDLGERLRPAGSEDSRTDRAGISVLTLREAPTDGFTVVVDRGRVKREKLDGQLRVRVADYDPVRHIAYVNPVTTLAERLWREEPGRPVRWADREARSTLRIPLFHGSGADLMATDKWFDGDLYFRASDDDSSIRTVTADLAELAAAGDRTDRFREPGGDDRAFMRAAAFSDKDDEPDGDGKKSLIDSIDVSALLTNLTNLAKGEFQKLALEGGKLVLGFLLDQWGLKDVKEFLFPKSTSTQILEKLDKLLDAVTRIEGKVDVIKTDGLRKAYTDRRQELVNKEGVVRNLYSQYQMANATTSAQDRQELSLDLLRTIGTLMVPYEGTLAGLLQSDSIGSDSIYTAASRFLGDRPFFTADGTAKIKALYQTLSVVQLQEAMLLAEYHNAQFERHPRDPGKAVKSIENAKNAVALQKSQLKPAPPAGVVIDTAKRRVWTRVPAEGRRDGNSVFQEWIRWAESSCTKTCYGTLKTQWKFERRDQIWRDLRKRLGPEFGDSREWRPGTVEDIQGLYAGRGSRTPAAYLQEQGGVGDYVKNWIWPADAFEFYDRSVLYHWISSRVNLNTAGVSKSEFNFNSMGESFPWPKWGNDYLRDGKVNRDSRIFRELAKLDGYVMYWRPMTDADDYYYR